MSSGNPFYGLDEEVDDDTFVNYRANNHNSVEARAYEAKRQQLLDQRRDVENQTLQSSNQAVRALFEAEQVGIATAEELVHQGEQLKKIDSQLDDINHTVKTTQKHLTAMKSVFSGIKGYFSRSNTADSSTKSVTSPEEQPQSGLERTIGSIRGASENARNQNHPTLVSRGLTDTSGFGAGFDDDDSPTAAPSRSAYVDQQVNNHLSLLSSGLGRLKNLAEGIGTELDNQNELVETIDNKVNLAEGSISSQNRQMNRLLK